MKIKDRLEPIQILKKKIFLQNRQNLRAGSPRPWGQQFVIVALWTLHFLLLLPELEL